MLCTFRSTLCLTQETHCQNVFSCLSVTVVLEVNSHRIKGRRDEKRLLFFTLETNKSERNYMSCLYKCRTKQFYCASWARMFTCYLCVCVCVCPTVVHISFPKSKVGSNQLVLSRQFAVRPPHVCLLCMFFCEFYEFDVCVCVCVCKHA